LNCLGMISQVVISGIFSGTSGVSHPGPDDPRQAPKLRVRPPESAKAEGRCLECTGMIDVRRRQANAGLRTIRQQRHTFSSFY
jgi:hypothetical protein